MRPYSQSSSFDALSLSADTHPFELLPYARQHGRLSPEAEALVARHPFAAAAYALDVVRGRFEAGEAAIASRPSVALQYAKLCLDGRFPLGEAVIAQDSVAAYHYAVEVLRARFPEGEPAVFRDKDLTARYCRQFGVEPPKPPSLWSRIHQWARRYQLGPVAR